MTGFVAAILERLETFENYAIVKGNRKDLATALGRSLKTITRNFKAFESCGLGKLESRSGVHGGFVLKLEPSKFNFATGNNILTSPSKEDQILIDSLFPKKPKRKRTGERRTKVEMDLVRASQQMLSEKEREYNEFLTHRNNLEPLGWSFFEKTDDPYRYRRAWMVGQLYDAWVSNYEQLYQRKYVETAQKGYTTPKGIRNKPATHSHCLSERFFGTRNWQYCLNLLDYCDSMNYDINNYIGAVFGRYEYSYLESFSTTLMPSLAVTASSRGKEIYEDSKHHMKDYWKAYKNVPTNEGGNMTIRALAGAIRQSTIDAGVDITQANTTPQWTPTNRSDTYKAYYTETLEQASKRLNETDLKLLTQFLNTQYGYIYNNAKLPLLDVVGYLAYSKACKAMKPMPGNFVENAQFLGTLLAVDYKTNPYGITEEMGKDMQLKQAANNVIACDSDDGYASIRVGTVELQRTGAYHSQAQLTAVISQVEDLIPLTDLGFLDRGAIIEQFESKVDNELYIW